MKIKGNRGGKCFNGDPLLTKTILSLKAMLKTLQVDDKGFYIEFGEMMMSEETTSIPLPIVNLLKEFLELIEPPNTLPPHTYQV